MMKGAIGGLVGLASVLFLMVKATSLVEIIANFGAMFARIGLHAA